ncbi:MAG: hypothetical protein L7F77_00875 [Candidatus Magnetominusculus sp. LBB02]|nr:hypothetical protein [Candidatus Magnetominusculus sp. LBB02]
MGSLLNMAAKDDIGEIKDEIKEVIDDVSRLEVKMESIKELIKKSKVDSIKWMFALWASQIGIMTAALKFFIK